MSAHPRKSAVAAVVLSGQIDTSRTTKACNHAALAITRSLGRRGIRVFRFHPNHGLYDLSSRYCRHVTGPNFFENEPATIQALLSFRRHLGRTPILFAACDGAAAFIARNAAALERSYKVVSPPMDCISNIQDKGRLYQFAERLGLGVPKTFLPANEEEAAAAAGLLEYPAIIKPRDSQDWKYGSIKKFVKQAKVVKVCSPQELLRPYHQLAALEPRLMFQEIIPGGDEDLLTFLGYIDREGKPTAGCIRRKLLQSPPQFGYCCLSETVRDKEVMNAAIKLLLALGYRGIGCVEFKRNRRDGKLKLMEINARAVRTTALACAAGVDLPYIAYCDVAGSPLPPCFTYQQGLRWMHFMDGLMAAHDLGPGSQLNISTWFRSLRYPIVDAECSIDDPLPFLCHFSRQMTGLTIQAARHRVLAPTVFFVRQASRKPAGALRCLHPGL